MCGTMLLVHNVLKFQNQRNITENISSKRVSTILESQNLHLGSKPKHSEIVMKIWKQFFSAKASTSQLKHGLLRFFMRKSESLIFRPRTFSLLQTFYFTIECKFNLLCLESEAALCLLTFALIAVCDCTRWCLWTICCGELYLHAAHLCNRIPSWNSVNS